MSSCGFCSFPTYYGGNLKGWSHNGYMPRIRTIYDLKPARMPFDFTEIVAALAPRPFLACAPIRDDNGVYVLRGERRMNSDRAAFEKELPVLRQQRVQQIKQQRLRLFLEDLRRAAKVEDHRKEINATQRRLAV